MSTVPRFNAGEEHNQELFQLDYKDSGDLVRHYSTTRSALTTFLLTVSLISFQAYIRNPKTGEFFVPVAYILLFASTMVCLYFSYQTVAIQRHQSALWRWTKMGRPGEVLPNRSASRKLKVVFPGMVTDPMNYLLIAIVISTILFFNYRLVGDFGSDSVKSWSFVAVVTVFGPGILLLCIHLFAARIPERWPILIVVKISHILVIAILAAVMCEALSLLLADHHIWEALVQKKVVD